MMSCGEGQCLNEKIWPSSRVPAAKASTDVGDTESRAPGRRSVPYAEILGCRSAPQFIRSRIPCKPALGGRRTPAPGGD